jgi:hypothetical protein
MTSHQIQEPIPCQLARWSQWAEQFQPDALIPVNRFSEINEDLASVRASLKYQKITDPVVVAAQLLPFDHLIEEWAQSLPPSWHYKSHRAIGPDGVPSSRYDLQCDEYSALWIACVWNCYRNARLLIHEAIIVATLKNGTEEQKANLQGSATVIAAMANGICHSVAYHLNSWQQSPPADSLGEATPWDSDPSPGAFLLLWPLFFSGMLRTSPPDQREWVAKTIRRIGLQMGLRLAMLMADMLDSMALSFSHEDTFLLGEWHPN